MERRHASLHQPGGLTHGRLFGICLVLIRSLMNVFPFSSFFYKVCFPVAKLVKRLGPHRARLRCLSESIVCPTLCVPVESFLRGSRWRQRRTFVVTVPASIKPILMTNKLRHRFAEQVQLVLKRLVNILMSPLAGNELISQHLLLLAPSEMESFAPVRICDVRFLLLQQSIK